MNIIKRTKQQQMSIDMRFPTMWNVRPAKAQTNLRICAVDQSLGLLLDYTIIVKLLPEQQLETLGFKGDCTCSSESTHFKCQIVGNYIFFAHMMQGLTNIILIIAGQCFCSSIFHRMRYKAFRIDNRAVWIPYQFQHSVAIRS